MVTATSLLGQLTVVSDRFDRSRGFYVALLGALDVTAVAEFGDEEEDDAEVEAVGFVLGDGATLWVVTGAVPTRGLHLSLRAPDAARLALAHRAALDHGGVQRRAPRRWTPYAVGDVIAAVDDPTGNTVELTAPEQQPA